MPVRPFIGSVLRDVAVLLVDAAERVDPQPVLRPLVWPGPWVRAAAEPRCGYRRRASR